MTDSNGVRPPTDAERSLGEIVAEVSEKASLLVREEIELAKAELADRAKKFGRAAAAAGAAGVFVGLAVIYGLHSLAYFLQDLLNTQVWVGYLIVTALLVLLGAVAGFLAYRFFESGSEPPASIEEAKLTRETLEHAIEDPGPKATTPIGPGTTTSGPPQDGG